MPGESLNGAARYADSAASTDGLYHLLRAKLAGGQISEALEQIADFVRTCIADPRSVARVFSDPGLDAICQEIGAKVNAGLELAAPIHDPISTVDCVFLATRIYRTGGHTAVIEDLIRTRRFGSRNRIVCTNLDLESADSLRQIASERFGFDVQCQIAPAGSLAQKLEWTLGNLASSGAKTLILMNHNYDSVSIAAAQKGLGIPTIFFHHADHQLCLGVSLAHATHVDPSPMGYHNCKNNLHVNGPLYWPLVSQDPGYSPRPTDDHRSWIRSCSSGSEGKFDFAYKYSYFDLVAEILARTQGEHLHIGPLGKANLRRIHDGLGRQGIASSRFVHIEWVPSVAAVLQQHDVDVYIASFPLGGGKVMIEAMAAAKPMIAHNSYISPFFGGIDMLYNGAFTWSNPKQLFDHLATLDRNTLIEEGRHARMHFENTHTLSRLCEAIDAGPHAPAPPAEREHAKDALQSYLDDVLFSDAKYRGEFNSQIQQIRGECNAQIQQISVMHRSEVESLQHAHDLEVEEMIRASTERIKTYKI